MKYAHRDAMHRPLVDPRHGPGITSTYWSPIINTSASDVADLFVITKLFGITKETTVFGYKKKCRRPRNKIQSEFKLSLADVAAL